MNRFFFFFSLIAVLSCGKNDVYYTRKLSAFDPEIVSHFPKKPTTYYTLSIQNDTIHDVTSILLLNNYNNHKYRVLKDSLLKHSKVAYSPGETCLLVVNMYSNEKNWFKSFKTKDTSYLHKDCLKQKLPVPNFWPLNLKAGNITGLPETFNILVFNASHDNINKKYMSLNVYMPPYWKHGYSKGVALNDSTRQIIYWFVLW